MYRVVLIDDEAVILEGLKRVVKWENYDCQVVGTAFDAKSGNDLIRQEKPDILFTDIRMPGQSGLTMLVVTHEMAFARDVADRVIFMDGGVIVEQGPAHDVIENPQAERTRQFLARYRENQ